MVATPIVSLYPNPARDQVTLYLDNIEVEHCMAIITDITGKQIARIPILSDKEVINISSFKSGYYLITIQKDGRNISTDKLIIGNN